MLELLKIIKEFVEERKINLDEVNFEILLSQDSTFIDKIIEASDDYNKLALIYLLSNEDFNSEINRFKKDIINYISSISISFSEDYQVEYIRKVATSSAVLAREAAKEIISLIKNAKGWNQAEYGYKVATSSAVLAREDAKEIIRLITNAKGEYQASCGYNIAMNADVLAREDVIEIISLITNAIGFYQAKYGSVVATNVAILAREDIIEIIRSITNSMDRMEEDYQVRVKKILDEKTDGNTNIIDLYSNHFDSDGYMNFMRELENSTPEEINSFVKKFK